MNDNNYRIEDDGESFSYDNNTEFNDRTVKLISDMTKLDYLNLAETFMLDTSTRTYLKLGIREEIGEIAGVLKKTIRGDKLKPNALEQEVGDVMWYWAALIRPVYNTRHLYKDSTGHYMRDACKHIGQGIRNFEELEKFYIKSSFNEFNPMLDFYNLMANDYPRDDLFDLNDIALLDVMFEAVLEEKYSTLLATLFVFCSNHNISLQKCVELNIKKLNNRVKNGTLKSNETKKGDDER